MYNTKLVNAATVAAIVMATSPIGAQGFAIPEPASLMSRELGGLNIWKIVDAVRDYLKDKNAYVGSFCPLINARPTLLRETLTYELI